MAHKDFGAMAYRLSLIGFATYAEYLKSAHWIAFRKIILKRDRKCRGCLGRPTSIHHVSYKRLGSEQPEDAVALCHDCHEKIHAIHRKYSIPLASFAVAAANLGSDTPIPPLAKKLAKKRAKKLAKKRAKQRAKKRWFAREKKAAQRPVIPTLVQTNEALHARQARIRAKAACNPATEPTKPVDQGDGLALKGILARRRPSEVSDIAQDVIKTHKSRLLKRVERRLA
jgi:hypothetical protein